ncbi:MAG: hypothetical protein ACKN9U_23460 [Pirellulaceae bacterium]
MLVGLIAVVAVVAIGVLGESITAKFGQADDALNGNTP